MTCQGAENTVTECCQLSGYGTLNQLQRRHVLVKDDNYITHTYATVDATKQSYSKGTSFILYVPDIISYCRRIIARNDISRAWATVFRSPHNLSRAVEFAFCTEMSQAEEFRSFAEMLFAKRMYRSS